MKAVILAGGSGRRLWPLSRLHLPKQLLLLEGEVSLLQSHRQCSGHWMVVSGTATAINDNEVTTVQKNQSTDIPIGAKHRLENRAAHR